jgi:hypothetical protein
MKRAFFVIEMLRDFIEKDGKLYIGERGKVWYRGTNLW